MSDHRVSHLIFGLVVALSGLAFLAPFWLGAVLANVGAVAVA
jgi:hypothetical protein